ncbi:MAG TPA: TolC family protein [Gemmatimonadales bacterium]|nr:TolC family protein [Gemmatimonadales bacterium]
MWLALLLVAAVQVPSSAPLTLDQALRQARVARGRPTIAAAGVAQARAERRFAGDIPHPTVSYEKTGDTPHQHLFVDESFSWLLTRGPDRAAASARIRRAQADSVQTIAELVREVRIGFFDALGANETLRLVAEQVGFSDSLTRIARARLGAGDISRLEYDQVAQDARRAQQLLSETRETARSAGATLGQAIGWTGAAPPVPSGALDLGLDYDSTLILRPLPDSVPAVRGAVADSVAAQLTLKSVQRGRLQIPSLTAGAEWDSPDEPGKRLSFLGLAVAFPPWDFSRGELGQARARLARAGAEAQETRLEAARALADARIRLEETAQRARFARDSLLPAARELRLRAVAAYRAGETGVLPVLDALRSERDVVLEGVRDLQAFQAALARWRALLGRLE